MHGEVKVQTGCPEIENILSLVSIWKGTVLTNLFTLSALAWRLPTAILGFSPQCWTSSKAKRLWVALWEDERSLWDLRGKLTGMQRRAGRGVIWEEVDSRTGALGESFIWTRNWWWLVNILVITAKQAHPQSGSYWLSLRQAHGAQEEGTAACDTSHTSRRENYLYLSNLHETNQKLCDVHHIAKNKIQPHSLKAR